MDGIVYAAAVALGFASVENIGYLAHATIKGHLTMVFIIRSIFSVPGHVLFSGLWGYALGMSKFFKSKTVAGGLGLAIIFHGIFNGLAFLGAVLSALLPIVLLIVAVLVFWKIITRRIDEALIVSPHRKPGDKEG
jgi:RsiW-degrading membrane proteinase PrsW (M82 family)